MVTGGVGIGGAINTGGNIKTSATTASTSPATGALVLAGASSGLGVAGNINAGGIISTTNTTASTNPSSGAITITGTGAGLGVNGAINSGSWVAGCMGTSGNRPSFVGNWGSTGYWGLGYNGVSNTVYLGRVSGTSGTPVGSAWNGTTAASLEVDNLYVDNNIGIGGTTPICPIDIVLSSAVTVPSGYQYGPSGSATAPGGTTSISIRSKYSIWCEGIIYSSSDRRLKTNINPIEDEQASKLLEITPVTYNWKSDPTGRKEVGFIAQDLADNGLMDLVTFLPSSEVDDGVSLVVSYDRISALNTCIIKRQQQEIETLKNELAEIKAMLHQLMNE